MATVPADLLERLIHSRKNHAVPCELRPLSLLFGPQVLGVLFPHFATRVLCREDSIRSDLDQVGQSLAQLEAAIGQLHPTMPAGVVDGFLNGLLSVHETLEADARAILEGDPAARSYDEVVLTYPGFYAIAMYRVAHLLWNLGLPLLPRLLTEFAHEKTGIDIHPGATIGRRFCIDHGTGVVVGETTHIGDGVKLYQGVTLGALTVEKSLADLKRHPTIEDEVVIYSGATILGGTTVIGHHSVVAGNAWLTQSVPPNSVVSRRSEVRPRQTQVVFEELDWVI
jgi:serine O-acetyltransferase